MTTTQARRGLCGGMIALVGRGVMVLLLSGCNGDGSGNPNLTSLTLSAGALVPAFDPEVTSYSVAAGFLVASTTVTADPAEAGATVTVNGLPLAAGVLIGPTDGPVSLTEGSNTLTILVTTPGGASKTYTVTVSREAAASFAQQAYVKASNTESGDIFGYSVALSGDTLAVGARIEASNATGVNGAQIDNSADGAGAVYVFTRSGSIWSQQAYLKASNTEAFDQFGWSVALDRDTLAVGAGGEDSNATGVNGDQTNNSAVGAGAVYVFTRTGATWSQQAYLKASNTEAGDTFGYVVALSGDTLAVGAVGEDSTATGVNGVQTDNSASGAGAVYVFTRSGGTWSQQAYLKASNTEAFDQFGWSVALSGDTLAVGAVGEDSAATGVNGTQIDNSAFNSGAVYILVRSNGTWSQQAYLKASDAEVFDEFGWSMALDRDTLAVGAPFEASNATGVNGDQTNNSASGAGAVYVFTRSGGIWSQQAYLKASNTEAGDEFGQSVALDEDTLAVGAVREASNATGVNGDQTDNSAGGAGAVYVFIRSGSTWTQRAYLKASNTDGDDGFSLSQGVALSGDTLAVSAFNEASNATGVNGDQTDNSAGGAGAVYVFQ